jgi:hypothetical protein
MSCREIKRALVRKGIPFEDVQFSWQPTPEENVPTYTIVLRFDIADTYGVDEWTDFCSKPEALEWVEGLQLQASPGLEW